MMRYQYLIDACEDDPQLMAELSLLLAHAAYGLGCVGDRSPATIERVQSMTEAVHELERRVRALPP